MSDSRHARETYPFIPPINCVKCGKEILPLSEDDDGMVKGGVVGRLYAPFGSENDGTVYQIAICDACIEKIPLKPIGDYLFPELDTEIKHQKKMKDFKETGTYKTD